MEMKFSFPIPVIYALTHSHLHIGLAKILYPSSYLLGKWVICGYEILKKKLILFKSIYKY